MKCNDEILKIAKLSSYRESDFLSVSYNKNTNQVPSKPKVFGNTVSCVIQTFFEAVLSES